VYDALVYYQAEMCDNVFYLLVPSTVFTALHMCGFTSLSVNEKSPYCLSHHISGISSDVKNVLDWLLFSCMLS